MQKYRNAGQVNAYERPCVSRDPPLPWPWRLALHPQVSQAVLTPDDLGADDVGLLWLRDRPPAPGTGSEGRGPAWSTPSPGDILPGLET